MTTTNWSAELAELTERVFPSLETVYTHPDYFGEVHATPLQRAICRVVGGDPLGEYRNHPHVLEAIGEINGWDRPKECYIVAGIRTGKSLLNAAVIWYASQTVDLSRMKPGEIPRIFILATEKPTAMQTFRHALFRGQSSPILKKLIVQSSVKAESFQIIQAHSGKVVEVLVVAGSQSGSTVVSTWCAGCVCDEAPRWSSAGEGAVNLGDLRHAVMGRLLAGAQFLATGSPWAPHGEVYDMVQTRWKKPGIDVVVVKARGDWMNPLWWNENRIAELRARDPNMLLTECMAEFASPDENVFPLVSVAACTRKPPKPEKIAYERGKHYKAAMDPATRGNGWTLVISTRSDRKRIVVYAYEWKGTKENPLKTDIVMKEIAAILAEYDIRTVVSDQWLADPLIERAQENGFNVIQERLTQEQKAKLYLAVQKRFIQGEIEIPMNSTLRTDLLRVRKKPLQGGGITFELPRSSDGRHCDYVPSFVVSIGGFCLDEDETTEPFTHDRYVKNLAEKLKTERIQQVKAKIRRENGKVHRGGRARPFYQGV